MKKTNKAMNKSTQCSTVENARIAVIGLGYVGLPLAVEFAKKYSVVGFDINEERVRELRDGHDRTLEVEDELLKTVSKSDGKKGLTFSHTTDLIKDCNFYIITVPTPVDKYNRPILA